MYWTDGLKKMSFYLHKLYSLPTSKQRAHNNSETKILLFCLFTTLNIIFQFNLWFFGDNIYNNQDNNNFKTG